MIKEFKDRTLPDSLFDSTQWRTPEPDEFVRLDWLVMIGGALRRFYEIERPRMAIDLDLWRKQPEGVRSEASEWLASASPLRVVTKNAAGSEEFFELFCLEPRPVEFEALTRWQEPSLEEWLNKIAPSFVSRLSKSQLKFELQNLERELPEAALQPWSSLGFLGGLAKARHPEAVADFNFEWARFQAWISPQDEVNEEHPLGPGELKLNPTLQILRQIKVVADRGERHVSLIARIGGTLLSESEIGIPEAAIIDELLEEGRGFDRDQLLRQLSGVEPEMPRALERLIQNGFILQGLEEPSLLNL